MSARTLYVADLFAGAGIPMAEALVRAALHDLPAASDEAA